MQHREDNRNTWLFCGLLLLGGAAYLLTRTQSTIVNTLMFSANFLIYIGLLLWWTYSVRARLLSTRARSYIVASALLMMMELLVRVLRFRILTEVIVRRYVDYMYNIPLILIPTLFLMTCIRIHRGEDDKRSGKEQLILIPSGMLLLLVLSNDLHQLFYHRLIPLAEFHGIVGTYTYGPLLCDPDPENLAAESSGPAVVCLSNLSLVGLEPAQQAGVYAAGNASHVPCTGNQRVQPAGHV